MRGNIDVKESVAYRGGQFVFAPPKNDKDRAVTIPRFLVSMLEIPHGALRWGRG
jgi:hypothetical protein